MPKVVPISRAATAMTFGQDAASSDLLEQETSSGARWASLMVQAQDGDQHAYHTLLQEIAPYLRAICRRYLGHGDEVEDAVQEILLVVHSIRHTYERGRPFKPWLSTIASRRVIDLLRGRSRRLRHEVDTTGDTMPLDEKAFDRPEAQPDRVTARTHTARDVHCAVAALPPRQREAVELLRLKELSLDEAALVSQQSAGALKVACHRALKSLKSAFQSHPES